MIWGNTQAVEVEEFEQAEELSGKLNYGSELMNSVLENDKDKIDKGKVIEEALNRGIGVFTPDAVFEKLVKDYSMAKQLYGETLIKQLTGYDPRYVDKNIKIPEFQRELKEKIEKNLEDLKKEKLLDKNFDITDKAIELAALVSYVEEIENLIGRGFLGEKQQKQKNIHGLRQDIKEYQKGDRYKDISIQKSVKTAIRRRHAELDKKDLRVFERQSKGRIEIVYGLDASSSMKGDKLKNAKRAGIALAFKALQEMDKVGVIVFGDEVKSTLSPTFELGEIMKTLMRISARGQTDFAETIRRSIDLFSNEKQMTKHLILLTDAMPTKGEEPEKETLEAVSIARFSGITISLVGIGLEKQAEKLAKKIVELGEGRFYTVKNLEDLDQVILQDYYSS
ncbi:VWA domain-containing protein [Candidatus Woesearchaeota archaeon]|nr:VWA domain-containing protein [Candidatus Woesearchaeota archaeon]MBW3017241.1 VWA domain-containing protein [Candidatus Woesearchaeota archaeon]